MINVSIIVATYNPDKLKLRATLNQIIAQKGIDYEIIITDDGSSTKDFSWLQSYFEHHNFKNYCILENRINMGTVANILCGIRASKGEYVFFTSPGDILFDDTVLSDFYSFVKKSDITICFGNAVYYDYSNTAPQLSRPYSAPKRPYYYHKSPLAKLNFYTGDWINGACFFRERKTAIRFMENISDICKYLEDNSSTAFALAEDIVPQYFDRNVIWYEDSIGMSTSNDGKWSKILQKETTEVFKKLKSHFPSDSLVDIGYIRYTYANRTKRLLKLTLCHPLSSLTLKIMHLRPPKKIKITTQDLQRLSSFFNPK